MKNSYFYDELLSKFKEIVEENRLLDEKIEVTGKTLSPEEAIGNPSRKDFPILKGKEQLIEAEFKGEKGQAFTDMPGNFSGTIDEILNKKIESNYDRAILIATINAVCKYLGLTQKTIHCKDDEPEECSDKLVSYIKKEYKNPKIALIGYQPSMLEKLSSNFQVRIVDLNKNNIGKFKFGVKIEDAQTKTEDVLEWSELILATGSTIANATITNYLCDKPVIFYGTTIAGAATLMNLNHFCALGK
jgi:hypothetical protein